MNEKAKKARREYQRRLRQEHPNKLREYQERYWERRAQKENSNFVGNDVIKIGGE